MDNEGNVPRHRLQIFSGNHFIEFRVPQIGNQNLFGTIAMLSLYHGIFEKLKEGEQSLINRLKYNRQYACKNTHTQTLLYTQRAEPLV